MGSLYAKLVLGINNPRVAILSNGEEEGKGNQLVKESFGLLKSSTPQFIGNVEPKEVFAGHTDVVITDGFTGNIFVKTSESVAKLITDLLREEISASFTRKMGYLLIKPAFGKLKKMMDPAEVGAALLVGVNGYVFIGHGRSDARALTSALRLAHQTSQTNMLDAIRQSLTTQNSQTGVSNSA
jgi:phosphate acyltransferase